MRTANSLKKVFFFHSFISRKRFLDILWDNSHFQLPGKHKKFDLFSVSFRKIKIETQQHAVTVQKADTVYIYLYTPNHIIYTRTVK